MRSKLAFVRTFLTHALKLGKKATIVALILTWSLLIYQLVFWNRIFPRVSVANLPLAFKIPAQASSALKALPQPKVILFTTDNKTIELAASEIDLIYDYDRTAFEAFVVGRSGSLLSTTITQLSTLIYGKNVPIQTNYNPEKLNGFLNDIAENLYIPTIEPQVLIQDGSVFVETGKSGQEVNMELFLARTKEAIASGTNKVYIPIATRTNKLSSEQVQELSKRAQAFLGKKITFSLEDSSIVFTDQEIARLLTPNNAYEEEKLQDIINTVSQKFAQPVQEATFKFENNRVQEFKPAKNGREVDKNKLKDQIIETLMTIESQPLKEYTINPPVIHTEPTATTEGVNNLGIKELIGKGSSKFKGSIASRMHNIGLASSRLNGILIPPGQTFSFNEALGDVSTFTGYQQAYIIKEGKTILGDGGGVCQVSTTFFRAALNAGLPILERQPHSYRVTYYEQDSGPGLDATVFQPSPDLKIKNDTPAHILIQTSFDQKNATLIFELYGTSDGRIVEVSKPKTWDVTPPPPDLYQDDPTLPVGVVKQIERRTNGSKVSFDYKVTRNEEVLQNRTFYSVYRPWQAVYLRGIASQ